MLTGLYAFLIIIFVIIFAWWGWSKLPRIQNWDEVLAYMVLFISIVIGSGILIIWVTMNP